MATAATQLGSERFARQFNEQLDAAVPAYREARQGAAGFFNADNALEAGQNFVGAGNRFGLREARAAIARMPENEQRLFYDGYADRLAQTLEKTGDTTNVLNKVAQSDAAREELAIGLGSQERAQEFIARRRVEQVMDRMRGALGGSQTARNLAFAGLAGGAAGGIDLYNTGSLVHAGGAGGAAALFAGGLRQVATRLGQHIDERVAQRVGEMLASPDHSVVDRGIRIVANNRTLANALQALDTMTARVGGQQGSAARQSTDGAIDGRHTLRLGPFATVRRQRRPDVWRAAFHLSGQQLDAGQRLQGFHADAAAPVSNRCRQHRAHSRILATRWFLPRAPDRCRRHAAVR